MKIALFGAIGGLGLEILQQGLEQKHSIKAFVRNLDKVTTKHDLFKVVAADVFNRQSGCFSKQAYVKRCRDRNEPRHYQAIFRRYNQSYRSYAAGESQTFNSGYLPAVRIRFQKNPGGTCGCYVALINVYNANGRTHDEHQRFGMDNCSSHTPY